MKKYFALSTLLLIVPLVTSCRGMLISGDVALDVLDNVQKKIDDNSIDYSKFTYNCKQTNGDGNVLEQKVIFDKGAKFYYSYAVSALHIEEHWAYVKNNNNNENKIYLCSRYDGALDENGFPAVAIVISDYSDESWKESENAIIGDINFHLSLAIDYSRRLVEYEKTVSNSGIQFSSFNDNSLCAEGHVDLMKYYYQIDDSKIISYSMEVNETHYTTFTCSYERAQITYLNA